MRPFTMEDGKRWDKSLRERARPMGACGVAAQLELQAGVRGSLVWAYANTQAHVKRIAGPAK